MDDKIVISVEAEETEEGKTFYAFLQGDEINAGVLLGSGVDVHPEIDWNKLFAAALIQEMYCKNVIGDAEREMYLDVVSESGVDEDVLSQMLGV